MSADRNESAHLAVEAPNMDNLVLNVVGKGIGMLDLALRLAVADYRAGAVGWRQDADRKSAQIHGTFPMGVSEGVPRLVLCGWVIDGMTSFLTPIKGEALTQTVFSWLEGLTREQFGKQPDHDGHNSRGFRVYTGPWGHVDRAGEFAAITPAWACHGK